MRFPKTLAAFAILAARTHAATFYVDAHNSTPIPPYTNWATGAIQIQDAVDVASDGDIVLVADGVYNSGGRVTDGFLTNRVAITKRLSVQSLNGPANTLICGYQVPIYTNGPAAIRCAWLTSNSALIGFTLTNGASSDIFTPNFNDKKGGGASCASRTASISNCVFVGNAALWGGGVSGGFLTHCTFSNNLAKDTRHPTLYSPSLCQGSGAYSSTLDTCYFFNNVGSVGGAGYYCTWNNCTAISNSAFFGGGAAEGGSLANCLVIGNSAGLGGGAEQSTLTNCTLAWNRANAPNSDGGGGAYGGYLNNCIVLSNSAAANGGGSYYSVADSCLFLGNSASNGLGGGSYNGTLHNCTLVSNVVLIANASAGSAWDTLGNCILRYNYNASSTESNYVTNSILNYCCTVPLPGGGSGNFTNDPGFVDAAHGDFHLQSNSPSINSGNNLYSTVTLDLGGNLRIQGGNIDIGAYEFQNPSSLLSYAWLQQYGLPTDGTADFADLDHDGMNNWQEWRAGTDPTNSSSLLTLLSPTNNTTGIRLTWQSVAGKTYFLERSTNLTSDFHSIQSNIVGQTCTTSFTDTTATNANSFLYRVGIQ